MDLEAIWACGLQKAFDLEAWRRSFSECFNPVAGLGYPGVSDPRHAYPRAFVD